MSSITVEIKALFRLGYKVSILIKRRSECWNSFSNFFGINSLGKDEVTQIIYLISESGRRRRTRASNTKFIVLRIQKKVSKFLIRLLSEHMVDKVRIERLLKIIRIRAILIYDFS